MIRDKHKFLVEFKSYVWAPIVVVSKQLGCSLYFLIGTNQTKTLESHLLNMSI